ncbi:unnamed protein product [Calypogeia fissa]
MLDEKDEDDEYDKGARNGIVRKTTFGSQTNRHLFAKSKASLEEIATTKRKLEWTKKFDAFVKHILSFKSHLSTPKLEGKAMKGLFVDMGFI